MANKYKQFSRVEEAKKEVGRMAGALRTCARKKTFSTYYEAKAWGKDWNLNPYMCPWCDNYHLTRAEGDPPPMEGEVRVQLNVCKQRLLSNKAKLILKGLVSFEGIYDELHKIDQRELKRLLQALIDRVPSIKAHAGRRARILAKAQEVAEHIK